MTSFYHLFSIAGRQFQICLNLNFTANSVPAFDSNNSSTTSNLPCPPASAGVTISIVVLLPSPSMAIFKSAPPYTHAFSFQF